MVEQLYSKNKLNKLFLIILFFNFNYCQWDKSIRDTVSFTTTFFSNIANILAHDLAKNGNNKLSSKLYELAAKSNLWSSYIANKASQQEIILLCSLILAIVGVSTYLNYKISKKAAAWWVGCDGSCQHKNSSEEDLEEDFLNLFDDHELEDVQ